MADFDMFVSENPMALVFHMQSKIRELDDTLRSRLGRTVHNIGHFTAERSVANAPIKTGALRASIHAEEPYWVGDTVYCRVVSSIHYASAMHWLLLPYGAGPYNLGPLSAKQPATPEGGVGGLYIQRVAMHHRNKFVEMLERLL